MTPLPCWASSDPEVRCPEPATSVVIVPTFEEAPDVPRHYVDPTCAGHAPELMHELLNSGFEREDLFTATLDLGCEYTGCRNVAAWTVRGPNGDWHRLVCTEHKDAYPGRVTKGVN